MRKKSTSLVEVLPPARPVSEILAAQRERIVGRVAELVGKLADRVIDEMGEGDVVERVPKQIETAQGLTAKDVELILERKFAGVLHDVDYRIKTLYDTAERLFGSPQEARFGSRDLNLAHHLLDGYTFTANSPANGSISWTDCHIVYKGNDYTITNGNTANTYVYWLLTANTVFTTSNTKPALSVNDVLVAINANGTPRLVISGGKLLPGKVLDDGAISTAELMDGVVNANKIQAGAVSSSKLNVAHHILY